MDDPAFGSRQRKETSPKRLDQPPNQRVIGTVSVEVNGSGCEALQ